MKVSVSLNPVVKGLCQCGCGEQTTIARQACAKRGHVAGQPHFFKRGHHSRAQGTPYKLDPVSGCWVFQRYIHPKGYGWMRDYQTGKMQYAHRVFYVKLRGPIPESMEIDHLCRNRACVNPDHMEVVTKAENVRRENAARRTA